MKKSVCKRCGAPILFQRTPAGKFMPCEAAAVYYFPDANGPDRLVDDRGRVRRGTIVDAPEVGVLAGFVPHWARCSKAERPGAAAGRDACAQEAPQEPEAEQLTLAGVAER